ncbi:MAG TPA: polysaccharide deacetylase family protein [Chitinophagaceae bacterium]|nr:polysaccharide deacetylase family protein [Chitinophagaceae bacterium]
MKKLLFLLLINFFLIAAAVSQTGNVWNGKKCAVVLTYDDAIPQQLDNAIPTLDSLKLKATFYITAYFSRDRINDWKKVAARGYELGNHTLFHPCAGGKGREWVKPEYDLNNYSVQRMVDEIKMTNAFLNTLDGKTKRTFAFTCGDMKIHDTSFIDLMKNDFLAARAVRSEMHTIDKVDLYNTDCYMVNSNTAEQMIEWVKKAEETNSLLVILFHGVGGGNSLNVSVAEHSRFLHYLKQNEKGIWIPTMIEAAEYIKKWQADK